MVRVISEKLFSPPRSRHSSGETVDKELAARTSEALASLNSRRLEFSDYESSSDSHWDSEFDFEGDGPEHSTSEQLANGEPSDRGRDVFRKRKERRRERNKLSAQAYRMRRREQSVNQQKVLVALQEENTRLKGMVDSLETELDHVKHAVRHRGIPTTASTTTTAPTVQTPVVKEGAFPKSGPLSLSLAANKTSSSSNSSALSNTVPASFGKLKKKWTTAPPQQQQYPHPQQPVDNAVSRRQQISPVVDNFFSQPCPTPASAMTTTSFGSAPSFSTPSFSFPASGGACSPLPTPPHTPTPKPSPTTTAHDGLFGKPATNAFGSFLHQQQQHSDLNANAALRLNATSSLANANANVAFNLCPNNNMNNNNNIFMAVPQSSNTVSGAGVGNPMAPQSMFKCSKA